MIANPMKLGELFTALELPQELLHDLDVAVEPISLSKGQRLLKQGDPSDSLYLILDGQLRIVLNENAQQLSSNTVLNSGQIVGEAGVLAGEPRCASVYAMRDSLLGRVSAEDIYSLIHKYPQSMACLLSANFRETLTQSNREFEPRQGDAPSNQRQPVLQRAKTFILVALYDDVPVQLIAQQLTHHLNNPWDRAYQTNHSMAAGKQLARYIDASVVKQALGEPNITSASLFATAEADLRNWFSEQQDRYQYLVIGSTSRAICPEINGSGATGEQSNWLTQMLHDADRVLYLAWATHHPSAISKSSQVGLSINGTDLPPATANHRNSPMSSPLGATQSLILLHPNNCAIPHGTAKWLDAIHVDSHYHVRWSSHGNRSSDCNIEEASGSYIHESCLSDLARVARLITGSGVGLVLSGGATRGFAHAGSVRALRELKVPIDLVGGTSAGGMTGGFLAMGYNDSQLRDIIMRTGKSRNMVDYTLPLTSFFAGKRYSDVLHDLYGETQIEDLWLPFFCISTDITTATEVIHREGLLWRSLRASSSMPVALPPVPDGKRLLADGGILNNFPTEIMRNTSGCGTVIGIDVTAGTGIESSDDFGTELSGWRQLVSRLNPFTTSLNAPSLADTILALSGLGAHSRLRYQQSQLDLHIRPPVQPFKMMDYGRKAEIVEVGYRAALPTINQWLRQKIDAI